MATSSAAVENFPKVFVILIEFDEKIDEILKLIAVKFTNRPLLVQVKSENSLNFYIKRENEFKRVESASNHENGKITAEILLGNLKTSIIDANFSQFTAHVGGFIKHCHALDSDDDFCFRLLNLYDDNFNVEIQCEIFLSIIKSDNFKFFLAFSNVFELQQIFKPNSEELTSELHEKFEAILKHLIKIEDVENFKIILKFLSHNQLLEVNFDSLFIRVVEFVVENNFYEFHEVLRNVKIWYTERQILNYATRLGLSDLFINAKKSKYYLIDFSPLNDFFSFFGDCENFNLYKNVNVELMVQEVLIEMLRDKVKARSLIENYLMIVVSHGFEINLKFFYAKMIELFTKREVRSILAKHNEYNYSNKNNLLALSAKFNSNINSVRFIWKIMEKNFIKKTILLNCPGLVLLLLHIAASHAKSREICEFIWLKIKSLMRNYADLRHLLLSTKDEIGKIRENALIKSARYNNINSFNFLLEKVYFEFFKAKKFIYEAHSYYGNFQNFYYGNFYQCLAKYSSTSIAEFATKLLKKRLSSDKFRDFILLRERNGKNILHFAALNENCDLVNFFANLIESEYGVAELRKMLCEVDNDGGNLPYYTALRLNRNQQTLIVVYSIYKEKFSCDELKEIFWKFRSWKFYSNSKFHKNLYSFL